jgi:NAD(P)-dependent dehydrogenase (short-subunit alcohol dehydrogenase family)
MRRPTMAIVFPGDARDAAALRAGLHPLEADVVLEARARDSAGPGVERVHVVGDLLDVSAARAVCGSLAPADALLVWPSLCANGGEDLGDPLERILTATFCAIQAILPSLMRWRGGALWVATGRIGGAVPIGGGRSAGQPETGGPDPRILACRAGLSMLTAVVALELARKGVTANALEVPPGAPGIEAAAQFLRWTASRPISYLTAQRVALGAGEIWQ